MDGELWLRGQRRQGSHARSAAHLDGESAYPVSEQTEAVHHEVHHHGVVGVLGRHRPVSTMAKPACMNMTRKPVTRVQVKLMRDPVLSRLVHQIYQGESFAGSA